MTDVRIQWHPAFHAALCVELADEAGKLLIESEHLLGKRPMQIDILVITKDKNTKIHKNIGKIFRRYNIIEYKSPDESLCINDFYKVYGYACFYQSDTDKVGEINPKELTITFACYHYPGKMLRHIEKSRGILIKKQEAGIYYLIGDEITMQLLVIPELPVNENFWMRSLRKNLRCGGEIQELVKRYEDKKNHPLYQAIMDVIVQANKKEVEEERKMCEALREIFAEDFEAAKREGWEEGIARFQKLNLVLLKGKRYDDLEKASRDSAYREQLFAQYGI